VVKESGIYIGTLRHRRFRPRLHEFTYPLFMAYLDIDRIDELMRVSRLTGRNRFCLLSFCDNDHFGDTGISLRDRLQQDAAARGVALPNGKIFLLAHLRYLGYNFNPVSFFYCHDEQGTLRSVLAEVNNTFAETHNYWLADDSPICDQREVGDKALHFSHRKAFHVSPFLDMGQLYHWTFTPPDEGLVVQQHNTDADGTIFDATLRLEYRPWNAREVRRAALRFPLQTVQVITAIHWQALRLLWKRVPVAHHPGPGQFAESSRKNLGASWRVNG
jgi:uncharacterized protein